MKLAFLQGLIDFAKDNNLLNEEFQYVVDQYNEYLQNKEDNCNCASVLYKAVKQGKYSLCTVVALHNSTENQSDNTANIIDNYNFDKTNHNIKGVHFKLFKHRLTKC